jgi:hypothetical protein
MGLHHIDSSLFQVLVGGGCPGLYDIFQNVVGQPLQEHLLHLRVSGHIVCLSGQLFEF